jgi:cyclohexa-1,5-dienecarbonyl-CoA hydratase
MAALKHLKLEKDNGIARIIFNRPKHNVLNIEMMETLNSELEALIDDHELKGVLFLGEGPSWCAGVEVSDHKPEMVDEMITVFSRIFELIEKIPVPTIAAVHGACLGGGMEVAIACDMIFAAESAIFGQPEIRLGFFPPYAAIRLPHLIGPAKTIEICTTGNRYSAKEAMQMGFVSRVVPDEAFTKGMDKLTGTLQSCSPLILSLNKKAVKQHLHMDFPEAMKGVNDLFLNTLMRTEDTLEGIKSFEEKRRPQWKNR